MILIRNKVQPLIFDKTLKFSVYLLLTLSFISIVFPSLATAPLFLFCIFLQFLTFGGLYNGGSTAMSHQVAIALSIGTLLIYLNLPIQFVLYYIGIQSVMSYWVAGLVKIKEKEWRNGQTLKDIIQYSNYQLPEFIKKISNYRPFMLLGSWMTIIIEISLPLFLLNIEALHLILILLFIFHIFNAFVFGINRFIFAWLSTYPAIYYLALKI